MGTVGACPSDTDCLSCFIRSRIVDGNCKVYLHHKVHRDFQMKWSVDAAEIPPLTLQCPVTVLTNPGKTNGMNADVITR